MNSYGDPSSARGRAQYPGANGEPGPTADDPYQQRPGHDQRGTYRSPAPESGAGWSEYGGGGGGTAATPPRAPASSGRASVGKASVGGAPTPGATASAGRARVGRATVSGAANAPGASGVPGADSGYRPAGRSAVGGAPVGGGSAAGRATVGRASVRPVSANDPDAAAPGGGGPGGGGPGGGGPGGGGPGGRGPGGRGGRGGKGGDDPAAQRKAKRRKRLNWIIASFAVVIMLAGAGVVVTTYYTTQMILPDQLPLPFASTIYASDGKRQLAKVGDQNRTLVTSKQIPEHVRRAVAAAEDRKFYEHSGIDYVGIVRAAWNNFTGGSKQGASTITQQYARNAYKDLDDDTYTRKFREAVFASKLNDKFDRETIMQHYLNTIYFGRGAYGIEAAALTYFGKSAEKLDVGEGAVLAALIKQPEPDKSTGHNGYDPATNPEQATDRWNYVLGGMVEKGWLAADKRPKDYPEVNPAPKPGACVVGCSANTPEGNIINYVTDEMAAMKLCEPGSCDKELRDGGYKITTTIDWNMQKAAKEAASRKIKGSEIAGQPANLMAALVGVEPKTGRVLAYYGGETGRGHDFAGKNIEGGVLTGGHPPGSSFKVYTLAAALNADISLQSHWKAKAFKPEGVPYTVQNAGRIPRCNDYCTLEVSTVQSYNVPFYYISQQIGPDKVIDMARAAGVTAMWTSDDRRAVDLTKQKGKDVAPSTFDHVVSYGQYGITVLDHANGIATLANRGMYNKAHFVIKVEQKDKETGEWKQVGGEQLKPRQTIRPDVADDVTSVLTKVPGVGNDELANGRPAAGKTGTWELNSRDQSANAHAWMVGYTPQLATAVWVGNEKTEKAIKDKHGDDIGGAGLPAEIWKRFMNNALKGKEVLQFPSGKGIGSVDAGNGIEPVRKVEPSPPGVCTNPLGAFCPGQGNPGDQNPDDPNPGGPNPGGPGRPTGGGGGGGLLPTSTPTPSGRVRG